MFVSACSSRAGFPGHILNFQNCAHTSFLFFFWLAFSLENIYKELCTDIDGFAHPGHGDLSGWAKQGNSPLLDMFWWISTISFWSCLLLFVEDSREEVESADKMATFI